MWKRLRHPNIVGFIGVTRNPLQFVSEWMPNGILTEYLGENPGANRIGLVSHSPAVITNLSDIGFSRVVGCCRRSYLPPRGLHNTRRFKRGRCFLLVFYAEKPITFD